MCAKENDNRKGKTMLEIVYRKTQDIIPYENNPRNNDPAVDAVAESIKEFGFKNPIIIDRNNVIVAGHTRLLSAKKLGMDEVPTICADDLTDEQIRAFRLADNKTAEIAEWDFSALDAELERLKNMDMSRFGFDIKLDGEFAEEVENKGSLADKYIVPPFSILYGNKGKWLERKRYWISKGIKSELGRGGGTCFSTPQMDGKRI